MPATCEININKSKNKKRESDELYMQKKQGFIRTQNRRKRK